MRNAWLFVVLVGCGGGTTELTPRGTSDCPLLDSCAIATGSQLVADAVYNVDVDEAAVVDSLAITPDGIVDAEVLPDRSGVMLHALVPGTAHLHAVIEGSGGFTMAVDRDLRVADIAITKIEPTVFPVGIGSVPPHLAAFTGASIELSVIYRDSDGNPMLGGGLENWATTSGTLTAAFADGPNADSSRFRTLAVGDATAVVTANAATLTIDSRPAGSTKTLDLGACAWLGTDGAVLPLAYGDRLDVVAIAADGLPILGVSPSGPPTMTLDDPSLVTLTPVEQSFVATTKTMGSTLAHLSFDGAVSTFTLGVQ